MNGKRFYISFAQRHYRDTFMDLIVEHEHFHPIFPAMVADHGTAGSQYALDIVMPEERGADFEAFIKLGIQIHLVRKYSVIEGAPQVYLVPPSKGMVRIDD